MLQQIGTSAAESVPARTETHGISRASRPAIAASFLRLFRTLWRFIPPVFNWQHNA